MNPTIKISEAIESELLSWPDVTVGQHRFGGREFRVGKREIGDLHGSTVADLPFPRAMRDQLISSGKVSPHQNVPNSGWVSFYFHGEDDIPFALALFRIWAAYELGVQRYGVLSADKPSGANSSPSHAD